MFEDVDERLDLFLTMCLQLKSFREDGEGLAVKSACPVTEHELYVVPQFNLTVPPLPM